MPRRTATSLRKNTVKGMLPEGGSLSDVVDLDGAYASYMLPRIIGGCNEWSDQLFAETTYAYGLRA